MADPSVGAGDTNFQAQPPRRPAVPEDDEDLAPRAGQKTPFPALILIAGILWVQAGALYLALLVATQFLGFRFALNDLLVILCSAVYLKNGVELIRGTYRAPCRAGLFAILLGLYFFAQGTFVLCQPGITFLVGIGLLIHAFLGLLFVVSGVLALIGWRSYLSWQQERAKAELIGSLRADRDATEGGEEPPGPVIGSIRKA